MAVALVGEAGARTRFPTAKVERSVSASATAASIK